MSYRAAIGLSLLSHRHRDGHSCSWYSPTALGRSTEGFAARLGYLADVGTSFVACRMPMLILFALLHPDQLVCTIIIDTISLPIVRRGSLHLLTMVLRCFISTAHQPCNQTSMHLSLLCTSRIAPSATLSTISGSEHGCVDLDRESFRLKRLVLTRCSLEDLAERVYCTVCDASRVASMALRILRCVSKKSSH